MKRYLLLFSVLITAISCSKQNDDPETYPEIDLTNKTFIIETEYWDSTVQYNRPGFQYISFTDKVHAKNGWQIMELTGDTFKIRGPWGGSYNINLKDSIISTTPIDDSFSTLCPPGADHFKYYGDSIVSIPTSPLFNPTIFKRK